VRFKQFVALTVWFLALSELRIELILLLQHFTWTSFLYAVSTNKLATIMLIISPLYYARAGRPLRSSDP